jgi:hypothetical protein
LDLLKYLYWYHFNITKPLMKQNNVEFKVKFISDELKIKVILISFLELWMVDILYCILYFFH